MTVPMTTNQIVLRTIHGIEFRARDGDYYLSVSIGFDGEALDAMAERGKDEFHRRIADTVLVMLASPDE